MDLELKQGKPTERWFTVLDKKNNTVRVDICELASHTVCNYWLSREEAIQVIAKLQQEFNV